MLLLLLPALPLQARGKSEAWASNQYASAQRLRESLQSLPSARQTRGEYQRVIAAYRRVYYGAPASAKADPSVVAVAELLAEMGRRFNDAKALHAAIGQYKFLRREYPGSRDRFDALFTIGQIYQDDLKEPAQAKSVFQEFLRRYPRHHLADEARKAITEPVQQAALKSRDENDEDKASAAAQTSSGKTASTQGLKSGVSESASGDGDSAPSARITSIRHWSNPGYTRVAIGLEKDVKFESQRIDHPERIFFDLLDSNLASSLLGRTFDVDDGLLKRIRVAQFQPGTSRIVLEVNDHSDYTTFLLKNPPRLIIDVHSTDVHSTDAHSPDVHHAETQAKLAVAKDDAAGDNPEKKNSSKVSGKDTEAAAPTTPAAEETKAKIQPASDRSASSARVAGSKTKRTVVEADDDDDDNPVTVAKLDPPEVKPKTRSASTLTRPSTKTSHQGKRQPDMIFPDVREASPTENGDRSLIRALGLKIGKIVIDPGHGGHDTGTIGPHGLEEKDLVLDVGRRLGKLLQSRLGADVVYTRKDDTFIPLETRTSIANQEQADLFVSIHANSSRDPDARGVETYYLNFTSSAEALDVAARENAASDKSIHELQDLVKKIALKEKIEESREFASNVQRALHNGLAAKSPGIRDRGVKKAPFIVLIGANMPSILAEISFVSNPGDERRLKTSAYRQRIAESLYLGISKYVSGLSGVKVASKIEKDDSQ